MKRTKKKKKISLILEGVNVSGSALLYFCVYFRFIISPEFFLRGAATGKVFSRT